MSLRRLWGWRSGLIEGCAADGGDGFAFAYFPVVAFADGLGAVFGGFQAEEFFNLLVAAFAAYAVTKTAFGSAGSVRKKGISEPRGKAVAVSAVAA